MPWRYRLFDTIVVVQNYLVEETARRLGRQVEIQDFVGPIHTNYPVMLVVDPGQAVRLTLLYDQQKVGRKDVERWGRDVMLLLERMPDLTGATVRELQKPLSERKMSPVRSKQRIRADAQDYVPAQTETEKVIAGVWQQMFGIDRVGVDENFFDLGGHSLLLVQMHARLRQTLNVTFPIVTLFAHPTIRALARYFDNTAGSPGDVAKELRDRAARQKQALADMRSRLKK
jgi:aryl carrier-like protein